MSEYFPFSPETSAESDTESTPESSKSKKKKSIELGKYTLPAVSEAPKPSIFPEAKQSDKIKELLHGRPLAEILGEDKPETAEASSKKESVHEAAVDGEPEAGVEKADADTPLESLSTEESHEAVKRYVEAQQEALDEPAEGMQASANVEDAADAVLLNEVAERLSAEPEKPIAEVLDEAEAAVSERIEADAAAAEELPGEADEPQENENISTEEGEVPLSETEADDEILLHPVSPTPPPTAGGGGSGGGTVPPRSGSGSASPGGSRAGGSGGSGSGSGSMPPVPPGAGPVGTPMYGPGYPGAGPTGAGFNIAPTAPQVIEVQDITAERRAMVEGFLVGGILGYLIGRRRGRIKTEKRLMPIQRKLEKEVKGLHDQVAQKEQSIRSLAREKSEALAQSKAAQERFAERLAAAKVEKQSSTIERRFAEPTSARGAETISAAPRMNRLEQFTAGVIEAPAVVLGAAAAILPERHRDKAPAIDFTKKIEAYSPQELDRAAEKIKIDGASLKELARVHNLDERAVRRVVSEFIKGGNVKEVLTREMVQKELQFERDPKLRQAKGSDQVTGGGSVSRTDDADTESSDRQKTTAQRGPSEQDGASSGRQPRPDKATIDKLRKQQITQISVAATVVIVFAVIIVVMLG